MKIKIFKIKKSFKKGGIHINPNIYWGFSVCIALVIILISVIFSFSLFREINKKLTMPIENNTQETINKEKINEILEYFSRRKNKSNEIINSPVSIIDPSL